MIKQTPSSKEAPHETRALARFCAVQAVMQACQTGVALAHACQQASQQSWDGRYYAAGTIEDWYYSYRHGKFAALHSQPRRDRGQHRVLDPAAVDALFKLRREHPELTVKALVEELVRRGVFENEGYSPSTLHRRLAEAGLDRRSLKAGSGVAGGPTKAFELPLPNMLWMADCMHGPTIKAENGQQRTFLFALIDDCTRLCVHSQFFPHERLAGFLHVVKQAIQNRGVPDKIYTDNGAAFKSHHLGIVCANLGIRLIHCRPYHSWSKGKVERWFKSCQAQFLPMLLFEPARSMDELNRRLWKWVETDYNQREHSALAGDSPAARFAKLGQHLRLLDPAASLERLFLMRVKRRVRKDATFSLDGRFWEVPAHLRGQEVTVHFDPVSYARVEVAFGDRPIGPARLCNKQLNARLSSSSDYEQSSH